jgi:hypothetical protein
VIIQPPYHAILAMNPGRSRIFVAAPRCVAAPPLNWARRCEFSSGGDRSIFVKVVTMPRIAVDRRESPLARCPFVRQTILMRSMSIGEAPQIRDAAMASLSRLAGLLARFATVLGVAVRTDTPATVVSVFGPAAVSRITDGEDALAWRGARERLMSAGVLR